MTILTLLIININNINFAESDSEKNFMRFKYPRPCVVGNIYNDICFLELRAMLEHILFDFLR